MLANLHAEPPQATPALHPPRSGYAFPARQTLNYAVDWRVFPAGTVTFHQEADGDLQRITVTGDSIGAVSSFYSALCSSVSMEKFPAS